jgi:hypothetical protein
MVGELIGCHELGAAIFARKRYELASFDAEDMSQLAVTIVKPLNV